MNNIHKYNFILIIKLFIHINILLDHFISHYILILIIMKSERYILKLLYSYFYKLGFLFLNISRNISLIDILIFSIDDLEILISNQFLYQ
jgi:hypothetical protein